MKLQGLKKKYDRVTEIISALGLSPDFSRVDPDYLKYKCNVGTATHKAVELFLTKKLDERYELSKHIYKYFHSFKVAFESKTFENFELINAEQRHIKKFYSNDWSGAIDIECMLDGKKTVIDIKTSTNISPSHSLQLGAYMNLIDADEGYIMHLDKEGKPAKLIRVSPDFKGKWNELLHIYYSDLDPEKKAEKAKIVANDRKRLNDLRGKVDAIELMRYTRLKNDAAAKEKEYKDKLVNKLNIDGVAYNGVFEEDQGGFYLTLSNDSYKSVYELDKLISDLQEEIGQAGSEVSENKKAFNTAVLTLLERYKTIKVTKGSYRYIPIKGAKKNEES